MWHWLRTLRKPSAWSGARPIPAALWAATLAQYPFLARHGTASLDGLRALSARFLAEKEFHGADGLVVTDPMAVAIAAQACLPVLGIRGPRQGLAWYDDFVGVVVHADAVLAPREMVDDNGVVHAWQEELSGEAMQDGPVMLSWQDVADAGRSAESGYNVVIHEFVHKIDMRDGIADGCPPLAADFCGAGAVRAARSLWQQRMQASYLDFCDKLSLAERFGGAPVWLDPYAAQSTDEFFAVASEAYFVNPVQFTRDFRDLAALFDAFFGALTPAA